MTRTEPRPPLPRPLVLTPLRERLLACRDAEDYFAVLDVPFDPQVLQVNRLHVLRVFATALNAFLATDPGAEAVAGQHLREALQAAHDTFTGSTALDHRLFKVLRDRAPRDFVALREITVEDSPTEAAAQPIAPQGPAAGGVTAADRGADR